MASVELQKAQMDVWYNGLCHAIQLIQRQGLMPIYNITKFMQYICRFIKPASKEANLRHPGLDPESSKFLYSGVHRNDICCCLWLPDL
jgi:hypothetical protein